MHFRTNRKTQKEDRRRAHLPLTTNQNSKDETKFVRRIKPYHNIKRKKYPISILSREFSSKSTVHVRLARDTHEEQNSRSINLPHDVNELFFSSFISLGQTLWVLLMVLCVLGANVAGLMIVQYFIYDCLRGSRKKKKS